MNVLGAILIGFVTGLAAKRGLSAAGLVFLKTGVCGGFTTFSTFSLEAYNLFADKMYVAGSLYIAASIIGCLAGIMLGLRLADVSGGGA